MKVKERQICARASVVKRCIVGSASLLVCWGLFLIRSETTRHQHALRYKKVVTEGWPGLLDRSHVPDVVKQLASSLPFSGVEHASVGTVAIDEHVITLKEAESRRVSSALFLVTDLLCEAEVEHRQLPKSPIKGLFLSGAEGLGTPTRTMAIVVDAGGPFVWLIQCIPGGDHDVPKYRLGHVDCLSSPRCAERIRWFNAPE